MVLNCNSQLTEVLVIAPKLSDWVIEGIELYLDTLSPESLKITTCSNQLAILSVSEDLEHMSVSDFFDILLTTKDLLEGLTIGDTFLYHCMGEYVHFVQRTLEMNNVATKVKDSLNVYAFAQVVGNFLSGNTYYAVDPENKILYHPKPNLDLINRIYSQVITSDLLVDVFET